MSSNISQTIIIPPNILTKAQFKEASARKPKVRRYSTDDETPIATQMPEEVDEERINKTRKG